MIVKIAETSIRYIKTFWILLLLNSLLREYIVNGIAIVEDANLIGYRHKSFGYSFKPKKPNRR